MTYKKIYDCITDFCSPRVLTCFYISCLPEDKERIIKDLKEHFEEPFDISVHEVDELKDRHIFMDLRIGYDKVQTLSASIIVSVFLLMAILLLETM